MLDGSLENAQNLWLKALQRFAGLGVRVKVREFSSLLSKDRLPDADDQLLLQLSDSEVQYGLRFNTVLRRSQWAEGARSRLEIQKELHPRSLTSTSHSIRHGTCRILTIGIRRDGITGAGVDLEWSERPIHEGIRQKITIPEEPDLGLDLLALWCIKEAAWKANPAREGTVLSQYRCIAKEQEVFFLKGPRDIQIKVILATVPNWIAAMALCGL